MAGRICIAEIEELVPVGAILPHEIDTPRIYVHHVVVGKHEKRIERRTVTKATAASPARPGSTKGAA